MKFSPLVKLEYQRGIGRMKEMKSFQNLSYSQGVSLICLGGFAGSVMLAVLVKMFQQMF